MNKLTVIGPFQTHFSNKIVNEVVGHEFYSFTNDLSGFNQVPIVEEDRRKTTLVTKFGTFVYRVISFGFKNAPAIFSRIIIKEF